MGNQNKESNFLGGKRSRWAELKSVFVIATEFIYGFRKLHFAGACMTVFGSARFGEEHLYYKQAQEMGKLIAQAGFTTMTGGGPGIMEAANRGAKDARGYSIGCNIVLPKEQAPNPYLDLNITMSHFYVRKVLLLKYSYAYIVFPGGFGTMDELFETLTLIQTKKISIFPVVLIGTDYWKELLAQLDKMKQMQTISILDTNLFLVTDSLEEAIQFIKLKLEEKYGKEFIPVRTKKRWWLFEKNV